jgi:hypothetical protein
MMTPRVVYKVSRNDDVWAVARSGEFLAAFMRRERAVKFAHLVAQRNFQNDGRPAVVRLYQDGVPDDIILLGDDDPAANALAWIRRVSALRARREGRVDNERAASGLR